MVVEKKLLYKVLFLKENFLKDILKKKNWLQKIVLWKFFKKIKK